MVAADKHSGTESCIRSPFANGTNCLLESILEVTEGQIHLGMAVPPNWLFDEGVEKVFDCSVGISFLFKTLFRLDQLNKFC